MADALPLLRSIGDTLDGLGLAACVFEIDAHCVQVGASIGIALWPIGGEDPESLLRNADKAMYEAKSARRHGVRIFNAT